MEPKKLEQRWAKCLKVEGIYVKKLKKNFAIKKHFHIFTLLIERFAYILSVAGLCE